MPLSRYTRVVQEVTKVKPVNHRTCLLRVCKLVWRKACEVQLGYDILNKMENWLTEFNSRHTTSPKNEHFIRTDPENHRNTRSNESLIFAGFTVKQIQHRHFDWKILPLKWTILDRAFRIRELAIHFNILYTVCV